MPTTTTQTGAKPKINHKSSVMEVGNNDETELIEFLKQILKKNGQMPISQIKEKFTQYSKPIESIVGNTDKQWKHFIKKHRNHFVFNSGIVNLVEHNSATSISYNWNDEKEVIVYLKEILRANNGEIWLSRLKRNLIELPSPLQSITGQTHKEFVEFLKRHRKHFLLDKGMVSDIEYKSMLNVVEDATKTNVNNHNSSNNVVNSEGCVIKLRHQNGTLRFAVNGQDREVSFVIDNYYENGKKVMNLEWCLKVGDKVSFDAVLDESGKWKALVAWQGPKPEITTIIDKKRMLEDYLEANFPLTANKLISNSDIPVVTISSSKEKAKRSRRRRNQIVTKKSKSENDNITDAKPKKNETSTNNAIKVKEISDSKSIKTTKEIVKSTSKPTAVEPNIGIPPINPAILAINFEDYFGTFEDPIVKGTMRESDYHEEPKMQHTNVNDNFYTIPTTSNASNNNISNFNTNFVLNTNDDNSTGINTADESDAVECLKQILKTNNGQLSIASLKKNLSQQPLLMQIIIGEKNKQLVQFLKKHRKHFSIDCGIVSCIKYKSIVINNSQFPVTCAETDTHKTEKISPMPPTIINNDDYDKTPTKHARNAISSDDVSNNDHLKSDFHDFSNELIKNTNNTGIENSVQPNIYGSIDHGITTTQPIRNVPSRNNALRDVTRIDVEKAITDCDHLLTTEDDSCCKCIVM